MTPSTKSNKKAQVKQTKKVSENLSVVEETTKDVDQAEQVTSWPIIQDSDDTQIQQLESVEETVIKEIWQAMEKWLPITEELVNEIVGNAIEIASQSSDIFAHWSIDNPFDPNAPTEFKGTQEVVIIPWEVEYWFVEYQPKYWRSNKPNIPDVYIPYQFPSDDFKLNMKAYLSNYVTQDSILISLTHFNGWTIQYKF